MPVDIITTQRDFCHCRQAIANDVPELVFRDSILEKTKSKSYDDNWVLLSHLAPI